MTSISRAPYLLHLPEVVQKLLHQRLLRKSLERNICFSRKYRQYAIDISVKLQWQRKAPHRNMLYGIGKKVWSAGIFTRYIILLGSWFCLDFYDDVAALVDPNWTLEFQGKCLFNDVTEHCESTQAYVSR
jgi:hypothetical protein